MSYSTFTVQREDGEEFLVSLPDTILAPIYTYAAQNVNVDTMREMLATT